ncbi:MAG: hypothetical protein JWM77_298, partial [Rhodospirillales bacterium]|nr:hypothetical protein [Rhodospirillales bacterium]
GAMVGVFDLIVQCGAFSANLAQPNREVTMAAGKKAPPGKRVIHRDSGDGQFVKKDYADKHPKTTEREVRPAPKKGGRKQS